MVLIQGIQLVWDAGFGEQSRSLRTCFEHAELALLLGGGAVLSWCQRRGLFWELDWGTKLQQSYLYSSFLFFFSLMLFSVEFILPSAWLCSCTDGCASPRHAVWHGNKWAGAEDRTALCSCTVFVFLAVFVTVKISCSFNCYSRNSHFCIKYWLKYICLAGLKYFGKHTFNYKQVSTDGRVQVNNCYTEMSNRLFLSSQN